MATALIQRTPGKLPSVAARALPTTLRRSGALRSVPHTEGTLRMQVETAQVRVWEARSLESIEGEDAKITGMTRSLTRRVLALNVAGSLRLRRA